MKVINKLIAPAVFMLVLALGVGVWATSGSARAQENNDQEQSSETEQNTEDSSQALTYKYVAQPGDSYSLMARKAIQTYGLENSINLSEAQIIFAETNLTQEAGSPQANIGDEVNISNDTVAAWVSKAGDLNDSQKEAWNVYAQNANFNTDSVGQN